MSRFTRSAGVGSVGRSFEARRRRRRLAEWVRRESPWRRGAAHPPGIFDKLQNGADRRLRGCRPRRIAPESRSAYRPRWRHRTSRPPARRKVKACSLFPLLCSRRSPLHSDARRLDERSPHHRRLTVEFGTRRRPRNCYRSRDVYILLPRERRLWRPSNSVSLFAPPICI